MWVVFKLFVSSLHCLQVFRAHSWPWLAILEALNGDLGIILRILRNVEANVMERDSLNFSHIKAQSLLKGFESAMCITERRP